MSISNHTIDNLEETNDYSQTNKQTNKPVIDRHVEQSFIAEHAGVDCGNVIVVVVVNIIGAVGDPMPLAVDRVTVGFVDLVVVALVVLIGTTGSD